MGSEIALTSDKYFDSQNIKTGLMNQIRYANLKDLCKSLALNYALEKKRIEKNINLRNKHVLTYDGASWIAFDGLPDWLLMCEFEPNSEEYDSAQELIKRFRQVPTNQISFDPSDNKSLTAGILQIAQLLQVTTQENIRLENENIELREKTHKLEDFLDADTNYGIEAAFNNLGYKYLNNHKELGIYIREVLKWGYMDTRMAQPKMKPCPEFVKKGFVKMGHAPKSATGKNYAQFQITSSGMIELAKRLNQDYSRKQIGAK